jgi:hypothetical protein
VPLQRIAQARRKGKRPAWTAAIAGPASSPGAMDLQHSPGPACDAHGLPDCPRRNYEQEDCGGKGNAE